MVANFTSLLVCSAPFRTLYATCNATESRCMAAKALGKSGFTLK